MEIMPDIMTAISTLGFPIFACIMIFKAMEKQRGDHKQESEKWAAAFDRNTAALNSNTNVMQRLLDRISGGGDMRD